MSFANMFTAGVIKKGGQLRRYDFEGRRTGQQMRALHDKLPEAWRTGENRAINFPHFESVMEKNPEAQVQIAGMVETLDDANPEVYMPFIIGSKLQLLKLSDIEALTSQDLDATALLEQLTP